MGNGLNQSDDHPVGTEVEVHSDDGRPRLRRVIGTGALVAYGVGNIVGAGIYVLIGEVAGISGLWAPLSFLVAAAIASFSALSYGELSARYPVSAGEAVYLREAFGVDFVALAIGLMIIVAGTVSSAALTRGFVGYSKVIVELPDVFVTVTTVTLLGGVVIWGVRASVSLAIALTLVEVGGLALVLSGTWPAFGTLPARWHELVPPADIANLHLVASGAFVALFAYLGFEDMVNMAEEVRNPRRTMPVAIVSALVVSAILYLLVVLAAVLSVPLDVLTSTDAPLAAVYAHATGRSPAVIGYIGLAAAVNGALVQMVMGARVLYGMANQGWLHSALGHINSRTRTPIVASLVVSVAVLLLALAFPLRALASTASFVVLLVFCLVNLALFVIKRRETQPSEMSSLPIAVPVVGFVVSSAVVIMYVFT